MKISLYLDDFLEDLEDFKPATLSDISRFVKSHEHFKAIVMMASNSERSSLYLYDLAVCLTQEDADIELAAVVVLIGETYGSHNTERYDKLLSSTSVGSGRYHWSRAMAASYLLHKEVTSERLRQSA
jgi:hypothetical protein